MNNFKTTNVRCKKCPDAKPFKTISLLRKHQWAEHRETFKNIIKASKNQPPRKRNTWTKEQRASYELTIATRSLVPVVQMKELSAQELLNKLKNQSSFLNDVVSLISGMIAQERK